jgi:hypothetical protein
LLVKKTALCADFVHALVIHFGIMLRLRRKCWSILNSDRLGQISAEMYRLLDEERSWLNSGAKLAEMSDQEADEHVGRNRRLLRLAKELSELA